MHPPHTRLDLSLPRQPAPRCMQILLSQQTLPRTAVLTLTVRSTASSVASLFLFGWDADGLRFAPHFVKFTAAIGESIKFVSESCSLLQ